MERNLSEKTRSRRHLR